MEKYGYIVILIVLIIGFPIKAQQAQFGVMGGVMIADMDLKAANGDELVTNSRTAFGIGAIYSHPLSNSMSLMVELMFLQKGSQKKATNNDPNIDIKMNFIEIPVFFKMAFGNGLSPYIKAGPSVGIQISSKAESEVGGVVAGSSLQKFEGDLTDVIGRIDFGIGIGAGISYQMDDLTIFIDGRYLLGLIDIWKGGKIEWEAGDDKFTVESDKNAELRTNGIQIMLGVLFPPK
ncbi:porin family protein [Candidatus Neomarinimicrobiota bacterium]